MKDIQGIIAHSLDEARCELEQFLADPESMVSISKAAGIMSDCLSSGGKIISCGNGGSLCDATHFAEELTGRYRGNRPSLPAMAINDPAYLTCVGNDFGFDVVFSRWVEACGRPGDVLLALSTSGTSPNILKAAQAARERGMKIVALTSKKGQTLSTLSDVAVMAPDAPHSDRIQEIHIKVIHILIESIEALLSE